MPCSLPRSCTKVPREGKNTANAQYLIQQKENQEDLLVNPPDFFLFCFEKVPYIFLVRVFGDFIDILD